MTYLTCYTGSIKLEPAVTRSPTGQRIKRHPQSWTDIVQDGHLPLSSPNPMPDEPGLYLGIWVVSQSCDVCREGSFVFFRSAEGAQVSITQSRLLLNV